MPLHGATCQAGSMSAVRVVKLFVQPFLPLSQNCAVSAFPYLAVLYLLLLFCTCCGVTGNTCTLCMPCRHSPGSYLRAQSNM